MKKTKKLWAILLSILMVAMLLPWSTLAAFAEGDPVCAVYVEGDANNDSKNTFYFVRGTYNGVDTVTRTADGATYTGTVYEGVESYENQNELWEHLQWADLNKSDVQSVVFLDTVKPLTTAWWFWNFTNLTEIVGMEKLDTSDVRSFNQMFGSCASLQALDVSHFDTANGYDFQYMFSGCQSLTSLDIDGFDFSNAGRINFLFGGCSGLTELKYGSLSNIPNITNLSGLFLGCSGLTSLDLSVFSGNSNITDFSLMFYGCSGLTELDLSPLNTSNARTMTYMFRECSGFTTLDVSVLDTSNVESMHAMFYDCTHMTTLNLSAWDTSRVTDMSNLLTNCRALRSVAMPRDTSRVTNMLGIFNDCSSLTDLDLSFFDTSQVNEMTDMFYGTTALSRLTLGEDFRFVLTSPENSGNPQMPDVPNTGVYTGKWVKTNSENGEQQHDTAMTSYELMQNYDGSENMRGTWEWETTTAYAVYNNGTMYFIRGNIVDDPASIGITDPEPGIQYLVSVSGSIFGGEDIYTGFEQENYGNGYGDPLAPWIEDHQHELDAVFVCDTIRPQSLQYWFYFADNLGIFDVWNGAELDCSNVYSMACMFYGCEHLYQANVSGFDTSNVVSFNNMFCLCKALQTLDVSGFDTSSAVDMNGMFYLCTDLRELDVSGFDTSNVITMQTMFAYCEQLTELDLSSFNTEHVRYMNDIFAYCRKLSSLDITGFDTSSVGDMGRMFAGCETLQALDLSGFDTSRVTSMDSMFGGCSSLTELDLSGFETGSVTDMGFMFNGCFSLTELDLSGFETGSVTNMAYMFRGCSSLTELDVTGFDTANVRGMEYMFADCPGLSALDLSYFDTSSVTDMDNMLGGCNNLMSLTLGGDFRFVANEENRTANLPSPPTNTVYSDKWARLNAENEQDHDTALTAAELMANPANLAGTWVWETSQEEAYAVYVPEERTLYFVRGTYDGGINVTRAADGATYIGTVYAGVETGSYGSVGSPPWIQDHGNEIEYVTILDPIRPVSIRFWFGNATKLKAFVDADHQLDTSLVTSYYALFYNCESLVSADLSGFDATNVINFGHMFAHCSSLTELDLSGFRPAAAWSTEAMFLDCRSLRTLDLSNFNTSGAYDWTMEATFLDSHSLSSLSLGENFIFAGGSNAYLTDAGNGDADYTGYWVRLVDGVQDHANRLTASELMDTYDGATMAGTWVWENMSSEPPVPSGEAYAVYDDLQNCLYFVRGTFDGVDTVTRADSSTAKGTVYAGVETSHFTHNEDNPWRGLGVSVVKFVDPIAPVSTAYWFDSFENLELVANIEMLDTSNVTDMDYMFLSCYKLPSLDLSGFDTANVTSMECMFKGTFALTSITLGPKFQFVGGTSASLYRPQVQQPEPDEPYTGNWVRLDPNTGAQIHSTAITADELMLTYSGAAMAGTWVWETDTPVTGTFAMLRWGDENYDWQTTLTFVSGTMENGVLRRDGEELYYDEIWSVGDGRTAGYADGYAVWRDFCGGVSTVVFMDEITPACTAFWFENFWSLREIIGVEKLDTANLTDMRNMFANCGSLEYLDLSGFRLAAAPEMKGMLGGCGNLRRIDLGEGFRFFSGEDFYSASNACLPDVPNDLWNGGKWVRLDPATEEQQAETARTAEELMRDYNGSSDMAGTWVWMDAPVRTGVFAAVKWSEDGTADTMTFMNGTFDANVGFTRNGEEVDVDELYYGGNAEDGWTGFMAGDVPWIWGTSTKIDTVIFVDEIAPVTTAYWFCAFCELTQVVGIDKLDTSSVEDMTCMFAECYHLRNLDLSGFDMRSVCELKGMLANSYNLRRLTLGENVRFFVGDDFDSVSNAELTNAFGSYPYTGSWVLLDADENQRHETARDAKGMMRDYNASLSGTWVWESTDESGIFAAISWNDEYDGSDDTLTFVTGEVINGTLYDENSNVVPFDALYYGGTATDLQGFMSGDVQWRDFGSKVDTVIFTSDIAPKATAYWFSSFYELKSIQGISHLDTRNVVDMAGMFSECYALRSLDLSGFDVTNTQSVKGMLSGCRNLRTITLGENYRFFMYGDFSANADLPEADGNFPYTGKWVRLVNGAQAHDNAWDASMLMQMYNSDMAGTWVWETVDIEDGVFAAFWYDGVSDGSDDTLTFLTGDLVNGVLTSDSGVTVEYYSLYYGGTPEQPEGFMTGMLTMGFMPWWGDGYNHYIDHVVFLDDIAPLETTGWFNEFFELRDITGLSHLDVSNVTNMKGMFRCCYELRSLDLSGFDMRNVTEVSAMLADCCNLSELTVGENFRFFAGGDFDSVPNAELRDAPQDWDYSGYWIRYGEGTRMTAKDLMRDYNASLAGTWVWEVWNLDYAEIEAIPDQIYTGEEVTPLITVKLNGVTLTPGEDYTAYYYDNVEIGTAGVWITDGASGYYHGNNWAEFEIVCDHSLGHRNEFWDNFTPATCISEGYYDLLVYCADCGELLSSTPVTIPLADHTPGDAVRENENPATCTEPGSYDLVIYCKIEGCGVELSRETVAVPAQGHDWGAWTLVREATFEEDGLEQRVCARCGETEQRTVVWQGVASREIQFVVSYPMHYVVHMRNVDYSVYSETIPVIKWYPDQPLTFDLVIYSNWGAAGYIVSANGKELKPNADGSYTIPAGEEKVQINCDPIATATSGGQEVCEYCGNVHPSTIWGFLTGMIHRLFAFFKNMGR